MSVNKTVINTVPKIRQLEDINILWDTLDKLSSDCNNFYRGYNCPEFLKVSLNKRCETSLSQNYIEHESELIKRFFYNKNSVGLSKINNCIQILKFGQHYGLPTRLLDWTLDPFISLYFALGRECKNSLDIEIAILKKSELAARGLLGVTTIPKRRNTLCDIDDFSTREIDDLCLDELDEFNVENEVTTLNIDYYSSMFVRNLIESSEYYLIYYDVKTLNEREKVQKGLFTVCGNDVIKSRFPDRFISEKLRITINKEGWQRLKDKLASKEKDYSECTLFPNVEIQNAVEEILHSL